MEIKTKETTNFQVIKPRLENLKTFTMANINATLIKGKVRKNGKSTVFVSVSHKGETRFISTGLTVDSEVNLRNNKIVRCQGAELLNLKLQTIIERYEHALLDFDPSLYTCQELVSIFKNRNHIKSGNTIAGALETYCQTLDKEKTRRIYTLSIKRFKDHIGKDIPLAAIMPQNIQEFHNRLMSEKKSQTTINIYMTCLKIVIDHAIKLKIVKYSVHPFEVYKKPKSNVRDLDISVNELQRIRDLNPRKYSMKVTRDIFMLSYYLCGMNLSDMLDYNFRKKTQMQYVRHKTEHTKTGNNQTCFTIQPEAASIIKRYMKPNGMLEFGKYNTRAKIDNLLHRNIMAMASEANINKYISFYTARKSFAQHGFELGIPLETIEYCIGQSMKRNRPIFNYVKIMSKHADVAIRQILDNLKD